MQRQARLIHLALMAGIVLFTVVTALLGPPARPAGAAMSPMLLRVATFAGAAAAFVAAFILRTRITGGAPADPERFWQGNFTRAIVVWALLEAPCLLGTVVYYVTGDPLTLAITATGLLLFVVMAPGRLEGD